MSWIITSLYYKPLFRFTSSYAQTPICFAYVRTTQVKGHTLSVVTSSYNFRTQ